MLPEPTKGKIESIIKKEKRKTWINQGYRKHQGYKIFSHFVWNLYNPKNKICSGDGFVIHHKDGNKLNDSIENLEKIFRNDHLSFHKMGRKLSKETKRKISLSKKGTKTGKENPFYGKTHTIKFRKRQAAWMRIKYVGKGNPFYGRKHTDEARLKMSESQRKRRRNVA